MAKIDNLLKKHSKNLFFVSRVLIGALFFVHGAQKLFGWFGGSGADLFTRFWLGGLIESAAGLAIALGFLMPLVAVLSAIYIFIVYLMFHLVPNMVLPTSQGGGELALLYFAAFLHLSIHGSGKWALDNVLKIKLQ